MKKIKRKDINADILVCPFCYRQLHVEINTYCCGKSHRQVPAYLMNNGDILLVDNVEVIE